MYNVHFLYRYRTFIHYLKRGTLCLFLLCMFIPTFYFDIYLNSYLFFCIASSIVVLSSIFLTITGHYKFTLLEIGILIVIIIEFLRLIIQQEILIYYQALLKMVILLCWMVNLRNLIRNDYSFAKKSLFYILLIWLMIQFVCFIHIQDLLPIRFYNSVIFSTYISLIICFLSLNLPLKDGKVLKKTSFIIFTILLAATAIYFSSRASFIILITLILYKIRIRFPILLIITIICTICLAFTLKTDSSLGRILIWRSSFNIFTDNPGLGIGVGKFPNIYMDYQQMFLNSIKVSDKMSFLAGNTSYAYNDFLEFLCKFGLLPSFIVLFTALITYKKVYIDSNSYFMIFLFFISSCISYFAQILYCQLLIITFISTIRHNCINLSMIKRKYIFNGIFIMILTASTFLFFAKYNEYKTFIYKEKESYSSIPILHDNPQYLIRRATYLFANKEHNNVIKTLDTFSYYIKSDESELLYAKALIPLRQYQEAEEHLKKSIKMYPSKFKARYELMILYKNHLKNHEKGLAVAREIVKLPEKIPTGLSLYIKRYAKNYINESENGFI